MRNDKVRVVVFLENSGQETEVIILNKHESWIPSCLLQHGPSEDFIYLSVYRPIARLKDRPGKHHVAQRPQAFVGQSIVVAVFLFFREPDTPQGIEGIIGRYAHMPLGISDSA